MSTFLKGIVLGTCLYMGVGGIFYYKDYTYRYNTFVNLEGEHYLEHDKKRMLVYSLAWPAIVYRHYRQEQARQLLLETIPTEVGLMST